MGERAAGSEDFRFALVGGEGGVATHVTIAGGTGGRERRGRLDRREILRATPGFGPWSRRRSLAVVRPDGRPATLQRRRAAAWAGPAGKDFGEEDRSRHD